MNIFDSEEKPITVISIRKFGFLWVSRMSVYYYHNDDSIKTIGGISLNNEKEKATVFSVMVNEPQVTYIEAGPELKRLKKEVQLGKSITFSWEETINWNVLNAIAFNSEGKPLYEYRYAKSNFIRFEDLKWYPIVEEDKK
ncbi:hypothetical protein [Paenibacillus sp. J5C2022]|uniref:hypothetical protein n=1 Tax=Paenibacillus sp. J5C2022 TaxID=2977129 RepID=UPI0021CE8C3D|nr:hypothetical protein [Paenibacillus sp. J5C2022]